MSRFTIAESRFLVQSLPSLRAMVLGWSGWPSLKVALRKENRFELLRLVSVAYTQLGFEALLESGSKKVSETCSHMRGSARGFFALHQTVGLGYSEGLGLCAMERITVSNSTSDLPFTD
jgi:hypothetical protein